MFLYKVSASCICIQCTCIDRKFQIQTSVDLFLHVFRLIMFTSYVRLDGGLLQDPLPLRLDSFPAALQHFVFFTCIVGERTIGRPKGEYTPKISIISAHSLGHEHNPR